MTAPRPDVSFESRGVTVELYQVASFVVQVRIDGRHVGDALKLGGLWSGTYTPDGFGPHNLGGDKEVLVRNADGSLAQMGAAAQIAEMIRDLHLERES